MSGGSQLIRLAMEHLGDNPTGWSRDLWCGRSWRWRWKQQAAEVAVDLAVGVTRVYRDCQPRLKWERLPSCRTTLESSTAQSGPTTSVLLSGNHGHKVGVGRYASDGVRRVPG